MEIKRSVVAIVLAVGLLAGTTNAQADPCKVYAYGDSLSDVGNDSLYSASYQSAGIEPPSPPYHAGRYSNDRIWVESLATMLCPDTALTSFARGGAYSDTRNANLDIAIKGGLQDQIQESFSTVTFNPEDYALVWAGANNYIFDLITAVPVDVVSDIQAAVENLAAQGARRILVLNMPALGKTPFARFAVESGAAFPGLPTILNEKAVLHNHLLKQAMYRVSASTGANIVLLDVASLFKGILAGQIGNFANTTDSCLIQDESRNRWPTGLCAGEAFGDGPLDPNSVVFIDLVHPTAAVHQLIASYASGALSAASSAQVASAP